MGSCGLARIGQNENFSLDTPVGKPRKLTAKTPSPLSQRVTDGPLQRMVLFWLFFVLVYRPPRL